MNVKLFEMTPHQGQFFSNLLKLPARKMAIPDKFEYFH